MKAYGEVLGNSGKISEWEVRESELPTLFRSLFPPIYDILPSESNQNDHIISSKRRTQL